ncbi:MAG: hydrolase [Planctomycetes bacterium]|nr:hydrolase [Planctomycetota bacterium]
MVEIDRFVPPSWARGAHAQTLAGHLLRRRVGLNVRRERWPTPDGDFLDLDWFEPAELEPQAALLTAPLVVALHGLGGSTRSGYVASLARAVAAVGWASVGVNFRGCSGEPNLQPRAYHAGETGDLVFVLDLLRCRAPERPLAVVGFSLGGNVVLRWLGEAGESARRVVVRAAAVSVPFDLAAGADWMESGPGRFYARRLIAQLRCKAQAKAQMVGSRADLARALRARTFREFDDAFTAPLHGFRDANDYYARSSSGPWLGGIAVPTLVLHAADDPFVPASAVPESVLRANPRITLALSDHGGHVGFVTGTPWSPRFYAEQQIARFLTA